MGVAFLQVYMSAEKTSVLPACMAALMDKRYAFLYHFHFGLL